MYPHQKNQQLSLRVAERLACARLRSASYNGAFAGVVEFAFNYQIAIRQESMRVIEDKLP
jgi:hypothetical protein